MSRKSHQFANLKHPVSGMPYQLRLSQRKSVSLQIKNQQLIVAAPLGIDKQWLENWIAAKQPWIERKLKQQRIRQQERPQWQFVTGEQLPLLDGTVTLEVLSGNKQQWQLVNQTLRITTSTRSRKPLRHQVQAQVERWYRQTALEVLTTKTREMAVRLEVEISEVTVKRTRSKWGHCTRDGRIQYNWLILQAPEWVVDYLVVHETCHRRHPNHSRVFWRLVRAFCPQTAEAEQWLREHGHKLSINL